MKNNTQGFTLIELLIVIAIIGILAAVLIPNLLGAQKRAYDTGATACAKSIQTAEATWQIDNKTYADIGATTAKINGATDGVNSSCTNGFIQTKDMTSNGSTYTFTIGDTRGSNSYIVTPSSLNPVSPKAVISGGTVIPSS